MPHLLLCNLLQYLSVVFTLYSLRYVRVYIMLGNFITRRLLNFHLYLRIHNSFVTCTGNYSNFSIIQF